MNIRTETEYKKSRKISNKLATLIRSGNGTEATEAEYEMRDAAERAYIRATRPQAPAFFLKTCDEIGLMP